MQKNTEKSKTYHMIIPESQWAFMKKAAVDHNMTMKQFILLSVEKYSELRKKELTLTWPNV